MVSQVGLSKSMRIARTLEQEIRSGRMTRGDQLESENQLVQRFSASRNTVRKGLEELARQGLITTRSGIGSFVTYDGASIDDALGWTLALSGSMDPVETRLLAVKRVSSPETQAFLKCASVEFLQVDRLRLLSDTGVGISLERSKSPWREGFQDVLRHGLVNDSLGDTLRGAGLVVDHGEEWAEVLPELPKSIAQIMSRRVGEPMLRLRRVTRTATGDAIEYVESVLDPQRFGLHLAF